MNRNRMKRKRRRKETRKEEGIKKLSKACIELESSAEMNKIENCSSSEEEEEGEGEEGGGGLEERKGEEKGKEEEGKGGKDKEVPKVQQPALKNMLLSLGATDDTCPILGQWQRQAAGQRKGREGKCTSRFD